MKGKHSQAASARRDWASLESERDAANLRAERAEKALADTEERSRKAVEAANREISMLREAASSAVAPVVSELRDQMEKLRAERDEADRKFRLWIECRERFDGRLAATLARNFGITAADGYALVTEVWVLTPKTGELGDIVAGLPALSAGGETVARRAVRNGRLLGSQVQQIERARGISSGRRNGDLDAAGQHWVSLEDAWNEEQESA